MLRHDLGSSSRKLDKVRDKEVEKELQHKKNNLPNLSNPDTRDEFLNKFKSSKNPLIALDYDGTLCEFYVKPEDAIPTKGTLESLKKHTEENNTKVYIISGRDRGFLDKHFGSFEKLGLVAEHGNAMKEPGGAWIERKLDLGFDWKKEAGDFVKGIVLQLPGSLVEEKNFGLAFHTRGCEQDTDISKSKVSTGKSEVESKFQNIVDRSNGNLGIQHGSEVIELRQAGSDKGTSLQKIIDKHKPDQVFAFGDDKTDEYLFKAVPLSGVAVKVGEIKADSPTVASLQANNPSEVRKLIKDMAKIR